MDTYFVRVPFEYWQAVGIKQQPYNDNVGEYDFIHAFFDNLDECENFLEVLLSKRGDDTILWVSFNGKVDNTRFLHILAEHKLTIDKEMSFLDRQTFKIS